MAAVAVPIIAGAVGSIANLFGAKKQSDAATAASQLSATAAANALDYTKQADAQKRADEIAAQKGSYDQYAAGVNNDYEKYYAHHQALAPYAGLGLGAGNTLANFLGLPGINTTPAAAAPRPVVPPPPTFTTVAPPSTPAGPVNTAGSGMVTMRAPDGSIQTVPAADAAHYAQMGAQVVS